MRGVSNNEFFLKNKGRAKKNRREYDIFKLTWDMSCNQILLHFYAKK